MDKQAVLDVLAQAASYIATVQPELDKVAEERVEQTKLAQRTVGILVNRGIIAPDKADAFVEKTSTPAGMFKFIEKLASLVSGESLGRPSNIPKVASSNVDPFVREFFPELVAGSNSGIVE